MKIKKLEKYIWFMWVAWSIGIIFFGFILFFLYGGEATTSIDSTIPKQFVFPIWGVVTILMFMTFCLLLITITSAINPGELE